MIEKTCQQCGKRFQARSNKSKFCSHPCSAAVRRHAAPAELIPLDDIARALNIQLFRAHEWARCGLLETVVVNGVTMVRPRDLRLFVYRNQGEIDLNRVDKTAFLNMMLDPRLA